MHFLLYLLYYFSSSYLHFIFYFPPFLTNKIFVNRLCSPLDGQNKKDVANLFSILTENLEDVVQYNKDNRDFEGVKGTNITIDTLCEIMLDESKGPAITR